MRGGVEASLGLLLVDVSTPGEVWFYKVLIGWGLIVGLQNWFADRAPGYAPFYRKHMSEYYAPKNFNFWYYFGSLAMLVLVNQIVTGIFLTMHFKPSAAEAFSSVEYIMRDVEWGWLIRYMHSTGASLVLVHVAGREEGRGRDPLAARAAMWGPAVRGVAAIGRRTPRRSRRTSIDSPWCPSSTGSFLSRPSSRSRRSSRSSWSGSTSTAGCPARPPRTRRGPQENA